MGRRTKRDLEAGRLLKRAHQILKELNLFPSWENIKQDPRWIYINNRNTLMNWCEQGVPQECGKGKEFDKVTWLYRILKLRPQDSSKSYEELKRKLKIKWLAEDTSNYLGEISEARDEAFDEILIQADFWKNSGFKYSIIEKNSEKYYVHCDEHSWFKGEDDVVQAFVTLMFIHKGAGWGYWVQANRDNEVLLENLAKHWCTRYDRVKYRMLYAMQVFDGIVFRSAMIGAGRVPPEQDQALLHVLRRDVEDYLRSLPAEDPLTDPAKVRQVLSEIHKFWGQERPDKHGVVSGEQPQLPLTQSAVIGGPFPTGWVVAAKGSDCTLHSGIVSTSSDPKGCSIGWFSGSNTIILGSGGGNNCCKEPTRVSWKLPVGDRYRFRNWFLFIGCTRRFGGLHSFRKGARVQVFMNGWDLDDFNLMVKAEGHSDFFHRPPTPNIPEAWPVNKCLTRYVWIVHDERFVDGEQVVGVQIEADVSWDIDYVALLGT